MLYLVMKNTTTTTTTEMTIRMLRHLDEAKAAEKAAEETQ